MTKQATEPATEQMQCMEIWGGNHGVEQHFHMPGLDVWLFSQPYDNATSGGDVYYLSSCASGRITRLLLADVSGHGQRVSKLALRLRDLMRRFVNSISQAKFVAGMNEEFIAFNHEGSFATALVGTFFASTGSLQICVAGHPRPLIYRASTRAWGVLDIPREAPKTPSAINAPLGVVEGAEFAQTDFTLKPGDMILAYTDGFTEARLADNRMLGSEGLLNVVRSLDPDEPDLLLSCLRAALAERATAPAGDDLSLLLARADGSGTTFVQNLTAPFRLLGGIRDTTRFREF